MAYLNVPTVTDINDEDRPEEVYDLGNQSYVTQSELMQGLTQVGQSYGRPKTMQLSKAHSRDNVREKGRRIMELFPKYVDKSQSKKHANFLFG